MTQTAQRWQWVACKAGTLYAAGVFAAGFALGIVRLLLLTPVVGATLAVLIELPVILSISWLLCRRAVELLAVPVQWQARGVMAASAFGVLLLAEFGIWIMLFDGSIQSFFARYSQTEGIIGLLGQILFALFPLIQLANSRK